MPSHAHTLPRPFSLPDPPSLLLTCTPFLIPPNFQTLPKHCIISDHIPFTLRFPPYLCIASFAGPFKLARCVCQCCGASTGSSDALTGPASACSCTAPPHQDPWCGARLFPENLPHCPWLGDCPNVVPDGRHRLADLCFLPDCFKPIRARKAKRVWNSC